MKAVRSYLTVSGTVALTRTSCKHQNKKSSFSYIGSLLFVVHQIVCMLFFLFLKKLFPLFYVLYCKPTDCVETVCQFVLLT